MSLAPLLVLILGLGPHEAIPVASFSFLFAGVAGTIAYARRGTVDWRAATAAWIGVAVVSAALLGARTNTRLPYLGPHARPGGGDRVFGRALAGPAR